MNWKDGLLIMLIRLIIAMPLIVVMTLYGIVMYTLGSEKPFLKNIQYWEGLIFNVKVEL